MMNPDQKIIFGTDGWRGLLGSELNIQNISRVAQAFAVFIKKQYGGGSIAVGYDGRSQSDEFARCFAGILCANGLEVLLSDRITPTPVLSFAVKNRNCHAGVMITASHNPGTYNGLKFKSAQGAPFATQHTAEVETLIDTTEILPQRHSFETINILEPYLAHVEQQIDFECIAAKGMNVLIDSMAGAGGSILEELLQKHGIHAHTIFKEPLPDFAQRLAEPIEKNLQALAETLRNGNFSIGLATDGDADRLGVMDENGHWMNIQETILYLAQYCLSKSQNEGNLVKTSSITDKIFDFASRYPSVSISDVQVGFKYVSEAMMESQAIFGAEESGGFGFKSHIPERDGVFSALVFLEMMGSAGFNKLSQFIEAKRKELGLVHYSRIDAHCASEQRHEVLPQLSMHIPEKVAGFKVKHIQTHESSRGIINSLKFYLEGNPRWLLLRVSETEPLVRIYAEAHTDEEVKSLLVAGSQFFDLE